MGVGVSRCLRTIFFLYMFIVWCGLTHRAHSNDSALNRHRFNDKALNQC